MLDKLLNWYWNFGPYEGESEQAYQARMTRRFVKTVALVVAVSFVVGYFTK
jgi:hypothetical protein